MTVSVEDRIIRLLDRLVPETGDWSTRTGREAMIYLHETGSWDVHVGNSSFHVLLGEIKGKYRASGASIDEALTKLEREIK